MRNKVAQKTIVLSRLVIKNKPDEQLFSVIMLFDHNDNDGQRNEVAFR